MPITETVRWTPDPVIAPVLARRAPNEPDPNDAGPRFTLPEEPAPRRDDLPPRRATTPPPRQTSERTPAERPERRDAAPADDPPPRDDPEPADGADDTSAAEPTATDPKPADSRTAAVNDPARKHTSGMKASGKPESKTPGAALKAKTAADLAAAAAGVETIADISADISADTLAKAAATAAVKAADAEGTADDGSSPAAPDPDTQRDALATATSGPIPVTAAVIPAPAALVTGATPPGGTANGSTEAATAIKAPVVGALPAGPRTAAVQTDIASGAAAVVSPDAPMTVSPPGTDGVTGATGGPKTPAALALKAVSAGDAAPGSPSLEGFKAALEAAATAPAATAAPPAPTAQPTAALPDTLAALSAATAHPAAPSGRTDVTATPVHAVAVEIGLRALKGSSEFSIRLDPEDLGRVEVKLKIGDNGQISAALVADRVETVALLQREARTLERAFEQAGLKSNPDDLSFSLRRDDSQGGQPRQDTAPESKTRTPLSDVEPAQRGETILRTLQTRRWATGVDISI